MGINILNLGNPTHPLITIFNNENINTDFIPFSTQPIITELYSIHLKDGDECLLHYGRRKYDF